MELLASLFYSIQRCTVGASVAALSWHGCLMWLGWVVQAGSAWRVRHSAVGAPFLSRTPYLFCSRCRHAMWQVERECWLQSALAPPLGLL